MRALAIVRFATLLAAVATAVVASATAAAQVPASGPLPVTLVVDLAPGATVDPQRLRDAVARELGAPVVWQRDAPGGTLVVRQQGPRVVVSFDRPDGRRDGRALPLAGDALHAEQDIALLAGNVARDQTAQFLVPPSPPPAPAPAPAPVAAPGPPPPPAPPPKRAPCDPTGPRLPAAIDFAPWVGMSSVDRGRSVRNFSIGALGALSGGVKGVAVSGVADIDAGPLCGLQIAGVAGVASESHGLQIAGVAGVARRFGGAQISGVVNVSAGDSAGAQIATVNVASGRLTGVQIGVVNIASHADFQLGVLNIRGDGRLQTDAWIKPEMGMLLAAVKHGGPHYHWIYSIGMGPLVAEHPWVGIGLGAHLTPSAKLYVDLDAIEYVGIIFTQAETAKMSEVRVVAGYPLIPGLHVFAGPTLSFVQAGTSDRTGVPDYATRLAHTSSTNFLLWPGLELGFEGL